MGRLSRHAGTPTLEELRAKQEHGKCIICHAPLDKTGRGSRIQSCPGECRSQFLYAHNKVVMSRMDASRKQSRSKQSNKVSEIKNRLANSPDWWPPEPGLPCNIDPRRAMDSDREAIADMELRRYKENRETRKAA